METAWRDKKVADLEKTELLEKIIEFYGSTKATTYYVCSASDPKIGMGLSFAKIEDAAEYIFNHLEKDKTFFWPGQPFIWGAVDLSMSAI